MYPKEIGWKWVYWVNRALDGGKRRVFVNSVIHIQVPQNSGNVTGNIQHLYYACQPLNAVTVKKKMKHITHHRGKDADFLIVKSGGVHNDPCGLEV